MADERDPGLVARRYLIIAVTTVLLVDEKLCQLVLPWWPSMRGYYIIGIPVVLWLSLKWIWKECKPGKAAEERFERALYALTAGALLGLAVYEGSASSHNGNTLFSPDGEPIGDPVVLLGPDKRHVFMYLLLAGLAFWFSVRGEEEGKRRYH